MYKRLSMKHGSKIYFSIIYFYHKGMIEYTGVTDPDYCVLRFTAERVTFRYLKV